MITDKLTSYGAAKKDMTLSVDHRQPKGLTTGRRTPFSRHDDESGS